MGGMPCTRGLRIPVATIVAMVADGMTTDEILTELPDLAADDVAEACITPPRRCANVNCPCATRHDVSA